LRSSGSGTRQLRGASCSIRVPLGEPRPKCDLQLLAELGTGARGRRQGSSFPQRPSSTPRFQRQPLQGATVGDRRQHEPLGELSGVGNAEQVHRGDIAVFLGDPAKRRASNHRVPAGASQTLSKLRLVCSTIRS